MIREEDPRFINLEKTVGAFVIIAILGLVAVAVSIGIDKDLFAKKYTLTFTAEKGTGFARGMPVKLSGFRIGRIKSIALNEQAQVDIGIEIDSKYQKWIKRDSTVKLVKEGLVGDNIIEVSVGSTKQAMLKNGDYIAYQKTKGLEEVANDVADQLKPVLYEVKEIISYVNNPNGDIKQSLANIRQLTGGLNQTRTQVDALLLDSRHQLGKIGGNAQTLLAEAKNRVDEVGPVLEKVDSSLATVDGTLAGIQLALPPLVEKLDATLGHVEKTTKVLETHSARFLPQVAPLLGRTSDLVQDTDDVAKALKQTWPLKSHVPVSDKALVPGDSYE
ncbi:MlaD family protein [Geomesophilobacter sediminis]|uniref:MCE family protein n=1 Tax=Geomesophilobacter sediminis TaxID=2798584 RepID=A0A8J7M1K7_9BACT|nr:MlaD family protein [Geomesophilobacter sediminis]MBJ6726738.1 MCE family protein [Geomesophilobacter sediminis]